MVIFIKDFHLKKIKICDSVTKIRVQGNQNADPVRSGIQKSAFADCLPMYNKLYLSGNRTGRQPPEIISGGCLLIS